MCYYSRRPSLKNSRINEKTALSLSERPPSPRDTSGLVRAIARADYVVHGRENVVADLSRETCLWATSPASQRGDDPVKEDAALLQKYGGSDRARRKRLASRKELRLVGGENNHLSRYEGPGEPRIAMRGVMGVENAGRHRSAGEVANEQVFRV